MITAVTPFCRPLCSSVTGFSMYKLGIHHVPLASGLWLLVRHWWLSSWNDKQPVLTKQRGGCKGNQWAQAVVLHYNQNKSQTNPVFHSTIAPVRTADVQLGLWEYSFHRPPCACARSGRLQLPHKPAAMQLRHLYNFGSWVRMWFRTFLSLKKVLLQSCRAERRWKKMSKQTEASSDASCFIAVVQHRTLYKVGKNLIIFF